VRILVVASRDPGGRQSGRKAVLTTIVAALRELGHDVVVAAVARELDDRRPAAYEGVPVQRLPPPGPARIAANMAGRVSLGRLSLNEALYDSPALGRRLRALADQHGCEIAVADTIRTVELAARTGRPVIADLDDLLSVRYAGWADAGAGSTAILGYYGDNLPPWVARPAAAAARRLLWLEVRLARRRELAIARGAAAVSLVSPAEAARLASRAGVEVATLPMAVPVPEQAADAAAAPATSALFVGGLDYHPNLEGVRWLVREAAEPLERRVPGLRVDVVGHCPDRVRAELDHPLLMLRGYVDDLAAELRGHRMFVAPILSGTGVKTKVVEAMAAGLPVVTTPAGVTGLDVQDGVHCHVAAAPDAFAERVARLAAEPESAARMGAAGRELAAARHSLAAVAEGWRVLLSRVAAQHPLGARDERRPAPPPAGS
jgi:glycosyltransferase involved in cell wall biosynthesis